MPDNSYDNGNGLYNSFSEIPYRPHPHTYSRKKHNDIVMKIVTIEYSTKQNNENQKNV